MAAKVIVRRPCEYNPEGTKKWPVEVVVDDDHRTTVVTVHWKEKSPHLVYKIDRYETKRTYVRRCPNPSCYSEKHYQLLREEADRLLTDPDYFAHFMKIGCPVCKMEGPSVVAESKERSLTPEQSAELARRKWNSLPRRDDK